jgi:hypothetical protein
MKMTANINISPKMNTHVPSSPGTRFAAAWSGERRPGTAVRVMDIQLLCSVTGHPHLRTNIAGAAPK